jgi:hypothetical protein
MFGTYRVIELLNQIKRPLEDWPIARVIIVADP